MVESSHSSQLRFDDPDNFDGPAPLPAAGVDGSARQENPAATPVGGPDVSIQTGTSTPLLFPSIPKTINQATLVDFMSMWTLLQRRMELPSVPDNSISPTVQTSLTVPERDSDNTRSATPAGSPTRTKSPERFLHTPQSSISSLVRRAKEADRQARTPVRPPRTPVRRSRNHSESGDSRSRSPLSRSSSVESAARDESPLNFNAALDMDSKRAFSEDEDAEGDGKKISAAQYDTFRQAVTSSRGTFKINPAKTKRAARASLLDLGETEVPDRVSWLDQPSLQDTMASTAWIAQGLKEDEEVVKTTLSETLNDNTSSFKFLTVKHIFPREPYRLKVHRDALYAPKPPGDHGFINSKTPASYHLSHRVCLDTEELARRSAIYASLADSMVASVIEELSPKDERSKLLREKLAIIQEAQVSAVSAGFAAASNLQLLRRDALLRNFNFQPPVLSAVRTAPFEGHHVVGPEPKVLQARVQAIRQADRMTGSSVTFARQKEVKTSTKTSSKKTASRPSVFDRLGSPTSSTQRTVTQEPPFPAGAGRARPRPFQGSKKSGKSSYASSAKKRWRVPGGGSPSRLCPTLAESTGQLPGHRHRRGRGGHCIPATTSAHPSKHQFPDQEQPTRPSASRRCLVDEGGHRTCHQREVPGFLQSVVSGTQEDRRSATCDRPVHSQPSHGGSTLQDGDARVCPLSHQKSGVGGVHRHTRCLSSCADASSCPQVSAFRGQQEGVPVHLSSVWTGNFSTGVHQAAETRRLSVEAARCEATRLLRRLADQSRYTGGSSTAFSDNHQGPPVSRMDHQLREVQPHTKSRLPVHWDAVQHSTLHSGAPAENANKGPVSSSTLDGQSEYNCQRSAQASRHVVASLVRRGRLRLRPVQWWAATAWCQRTGNWSDRIQVPQWVLSEVAWWSSPAVLQGLPLAARETEVTLFTDASSSGWGAQLGSHSTQGQWSASQRLCHINVLEMQAVIYVVRDFLPLLRYRVVRLMCDNTVTVAYIKNEGGHEIAHFDADDHSTAQVVRQQGDYVGSRPSARSTQYPGGFPVQSRPDSDHGVDDGHGESTTSVCQVGRTTDRYVCDIRQQTTRQVRFAISGPQGGVDRCHVHALGQGEGPLVCLPAIQDGSASSAEDRSITRTAGDTDRSTATGSIMVSRADGPNPRRPGSPVRGRSRPAHTRRVHGRGRDRNSSLPAVKSSRVETLRTILRAKGHSRKLPTWCQDAYENLHNKCMNLIGQDSWRSVGRKNGKFFKS